MASRGPSRTAARADDDRGVAAVVGFVLVLAAAVTYYSYAAQNDVPRIGAEREAEWDASVGAALTRLAQAAGDRAGTDAAVQDVVPAPPEAPTQSMPFLAALRSARATGTLSFSEECSYTGARLAHEVAGIPPIWDVGGDDDIEHARGARGCMSFNGSPAYAAPFMYRFELGGLLRVQGADAVVLSGPPLEFDGDRLALTLIELRGAPAGIGVDRANLPVSLSPRPSSLEVGALENLDGRPTWMFTTMYPEAWETWFESQLGAGTVEFEYDEDDADTHIDPEDDFDDVGCEPPQAAGAGHGACQIRVRPAGAESLSISYARYDVSLG